MTQKIKRLFQIFAITLGLATMTLPSYQAHAQQELPGVFDVESADKAKINRGFKKVIDWILYIAAGVGACTAAWGIVLCSPMVGRKQDGFDYMKTGAWIIVGSVVFYAFLYGLGRIFS